MLLTITTTHRPATDLGFLLEKHPDKCQTFSLNFGEAHVFYPEAREERCTACLLLDLDPIGLVRGRRGEGWTLDAYVNDRPYVASSFLSVAIAQVFASALGGRSRERAELADTPIPLEARLSALRCRGGETFVRRLFEPLGYSVSATPLPLDEQFPEWGASSYIALELRGTTRLSDLLAQLYVLIPALDGDKHYFVGEDEVEKLVRKSDRWLGAHPERELIVKRFLKYKSKLARDALLRLTADEECDPDEHDAEKQREERVVEEKVHLGDQRLGAVLAVVRASRAKSLIDLGCGEGTLLRELLKELNIARIVGVDVSPASLVRAANRLKLEKMPERLRQRVSLIQGSLCYRDERFEGFDLACAVEVIEHLDPERLPAFERVVFERARPGTVVVTTPNVEYNVRFENLPAGRYRHRDHRFEWTRAEFRAWAERVAQQYGYAVRFSGVGSEDPELGAPTQMGVFTR